MAGGKRTSTPPATPEQNRRRTPGLNSRQRRKRTDGIARIRTDLGAALASADDPPCAVSPPQQPGNALREDATASQPSALHTAAGGLAAAGAQPSDAAVHQPAAGPPPRRDQRDAAPAVTDWDAPALEAAYSRLRQPGELWTSVSREDKHAVAAALHLNKYGVQNWLDDRAARDPTSGVHRPEKSFIFGRLTLSELTAGGGQAAVSAAALDLGFLANQLLQLADGRMLSPATWPLYRSQMEEVRSQFLPLCNMLLHMPVC